MISVTLWALAGTLFIFLMTTLGAALVFFFPGGIKLRFQSAVMGFSGGIMTAAAVWSLLLPAIEQTVSETALPGWCPAAVGILTGAVFIAALDGMPVGKVLPEGKNSLLFAAITLHNIPEGMAVGLAFALASDGEGLAAAMTLALGIGVQNFPEGAAVSLPLRRRGMSRSRAFMSGFLSGTVEPVFGMLAVLTAPVIHPLMPWLLSFSAGAMLYVTAHELIPEAEGRAGTFGYLAGFLLMMILDIALS